VVHERMNSNVRNGDVFIFIGRSRKLMKLLHAEDGGMLIITISSDKLQWPSRLL
jgi:hypothetical protein